MPSWPLAGKGARIQIIWLRALIVENWSCFHIYTLSREDCLSKYYFAHYHFSIIVFLDFVPKREKVLLSPDKNLSLFDGVILLWFISSSENRSFAVRYLADINARFKISASTHAGANGWANKRERRRWRVVPRTKGKESEWFQTHSETIN